MTAESNPTSRRRAGSFSIPEHLLPAAPLAKGAIDRVKVQGLSPLERQLMEALRPFAEQARKLNPNADPGSIASDLQVTVAQLIAARAAFDQAAR